MESNAHAIEKPASFRRPFTFIAVLLFSYLYPILYYFVIGATIRDNGVARYFATIFSALLLGAVALWAMKNDGISPEETGFQWKRLPQALLLLAASWVVIALAYFLLAGRDALTWIADPVEMAQQWLFVGVGEELLYRGYILIWLLRAFSNLKKPLAVALAVGISSFFFSTMHIPVRLFNGFALPDLLLSLGLVFALGIFFSAFYLRARNMVFNGLAHGSWNVPLVGSQGDFLLLIVILAVIEVYNLVQRVRGAKAVVKAEG